MSMYPGSLGPDPTLLPDTNSSLITFNVAALQSMMQAVAKEVAERVRFVDRLFVGSPLRDTIA